MLAVRSHQTRICTQRSASSESTCIVGAGPAGYYTAQRLLKVSILVSLLKQCDDMKRCDVMALKHFTPIQIICIAFIYCQNDYDFIVSDRSTAILREIS